MQGKPIRSKDICLHFLILFHVWALSLGAELRKKDQIISLPTSSFCSLWAEWALNWALLSAFCLAAQSTLKARGTCRQLFTLSLFSLVLFLLPISPSLSPCSCYPLLSPCFYYFYSFRLSLFSLSPVLLSSELVFVLELFKISHSCHTFPGHLSLPLYTLFLFMGTIPRKAYLAPLIRS